MEENKVNAASGAQPSGLLRQLRLRCFRHELIQKDLNNLLSLFHVKYFQVFSSDKELKKPLCLCVCLSVCDIVECLALSS